MSDPGEEEAGGLEEGLEGGLEGGDPTGLDARDLEELDPETLRRLADGRARRRRTQRRKSKKGRPEPVSGLLGRLFRKWGIAEQVARAAVLDEWDERVGARIAERTRPVRVHEDTLFVAVESSAWMMELRMMKRELLKRMNAGRERGRIEEIVFVQGEGRRDRGEGRRDGP